MSDDIKELLNHLISSPRQSQIQIDFDLKKNVFIFSVPIYVAKISLIRSVKEYVEARKTKVFKPHATSFHLEGEKVVYLVQKIPFRFSLDCESRKDLLDFYQLAKRCHQMLNEIAIEEKYKAALYLENGV